MPELTPDRTQTTLQQNVRSTSRTDPEDDNLHTELFKGHDINRTDTPETLLTDFSNRPDITILCDRCSIYIDIKSIAYHKAYHEALRTMCYQHPYKPTDLVSLLQRRNAILRRMKLEVTPEKPMRIQDVTKVDEAYELLKSDLEDVYEEMKQVREKMDVDVNAMALNCSPDCAYAVGMCNSENRRWKSSMEDTKVYQDYFGEDRNKCYLAIFDGYNGFSAAERSAKEFHHLLLSEMTKFDSKTTSTTARNFADSATVRMDYELIRPETRDSFRVNIHQDSTEMVQVILDMCYQKYDAMYKGKNENEMEEKKRKKRPKNPMTEKMHQALKKSYHLMDILLSYGKDEKSKVRWSGTSALTMVIQNTRLRQTDDDGNRLVSLEEEATGSEGSRNSAMKGQFEPPEELGLIHIANAGNTRAIMVRDSKPYRLTKEHTPANPKERERILQSGGNLNSSEKDCRVNGVLSVTRGLGNHGDKNLKDHVIVDPHVTSVPIDQYAQFLVLASNGVWEVFSDEEVASLMMKMLPSEQIPPPSRMNELLLSLFETDHDQEGSKYDRGFKSRSHKDPQSQHTPRGRKVSFSETRERTRLTTSAAGQENVEEFETSDGGEPGTFKNAKENMSGTIAGHANLKTESESLKNSELSSEDVLLKPEDVEENGGIQQQQQQQVAAQSRAAFRCEMARLMAETLTQAALMAKAKDNITVMVLLLPGCGI